MHGHPIGTIGQVHRAGLVHGHGLAHEIEESPLHLRVLVGVLGQQPRGVGRVRSWRRNRNKRATLVSKRTNGVNRQRRSDGRIEITVGLGIAVLRA